MKIPLRIFRRGIPGVWPEFVYSSLAIYPPFLSYAESYFNPAFY